MGTENLNANCLMLKRNQLSRLGHRTEVDYHPSLRAAARYGQMAVVTGLLQDHELDVNQAEKETGYAALHYAISGGQVKVVELLLDDGARYDLVDLEGQTPLHLSVELGGAQCLSILLRRDIDINLKNDRGYTIWHPAAASNNTEALCALSHLVAHSYYQCPADERNIASGYSTSRIPSKEQFRSHNYYHIASSAL